MASVTVNGQRFQTEKSPMTGNQLYELFAVPAERSLFLTVAGQEAQEIKRDDETHVVSEAYVFITKGPEKPKAATKPVEPAPPAKHGKPKSRKR